MVSAERPKASRDVNLTPKNEKDVIVARGLDSPQTRGGFVSVEPSATRVRIKHTGATRPRRPGWSKAVSAVITSVLLTYTVSPSLAAAFSARTLPHYARAINVSSAPLEVFEVYPPVLTAAPDGVLELSDGSSTTTIETVDSNRPTCQSVLVVHSFAYSYGIPHVEKYTPPSCAFDRVTWNLTVTSEGRQDDRLGTVSLGDNDIEVFCTSTEEPTSDPGIKWTYMKDMTSYLSLLEQNQILIFDLDNLISDIYTAAYNVTFSYFTARDTIQPADLILPISK